MLIKITETVSQKNFHKTAYPHTTIETVHGMESHNTDTLSTTCPFCNVEARCIWIQPTDLIKPFLLLP
jgi:hypothetical protein